MFLYNGEKLLLLLIKEPTSGLDAALAFQVMSTLKSYCVDQNKTIVTTIHQPSSQIFHMFENVLLLADGQVIESYTESLISWHKKCSINFKNESELFVTNDNSFFERSGGT